MKQWQQDAALYFCGRYLVIFGQYYALLRSIFGHIWSIFFFGRWWSIFSKTPLAALRMMWMKDNFFFGHLLICS